MWMLHWERMMTAFVFTIDSSFHTKINTAHPFKRYKIKLVEHFALVKLPFLVLWQILYFTQLR